MMNTGNPELPTGEERRRELGTVARGASLGFLSKMFRNATLFAFAIAGARMLGADTFGEYLLALGTATVCAQLCMIGLDRGVVRYVALYTANDDAPRVKGTILAAAALGFGAGLLAAVALFECSGLVGEGIYHSSGAAGVLHVISWALPFHVLMFILLAGTRALKQMRPTAITEDIVQPLLSLTLFVAFGLAGFGIMAGAWSHLLSLMMAVFLAAFLLYLRCPALRGSVSPIYELPSLVRTSLPLGVAASSGQLYAWLSTLILGHYADNAADVAVFQAALRTTFLLVFLSVPVNLMIAPVISDLHGTGKHEVLRQVYRTVSRWVFAASLPLILTMCLFARDWLGLFGEEFRRGAPCLIILAIGGLSNGFFGPSFWLLQMTGRQVAAMLLTAAYVGSQALFAVVLSKAYGALGAAVATVLSVAVFNVSLFLVIRWQFRIQPFSRTLIKPLIAASVSIVEAVLIRASFGGATGVMSLLRLAVGTGGIIAAYAALLFVLGLEEDDRAQLERMPVVGSIVRRVLQ